MPILFTLCLIRDLTVAVQNGLILSAKTDLLKDKQDWSTLFAYKLHTNYLKTVELQYTFCSWYNYRAEMIHLLLHMLYLSSVNGN